MEPAARIARWLGASRPLGTVQLMVFVPSADRAGRPVAGGFWARRTLERLGLLFGGATAYPPGQGVWRDDRADGRLIFDRTTMAFSFVAERDLTEFKLTQLREFLCHMAREARQGEIGLAVDGCYIGLGMDPERPA